MLFSSKKNYEPDTLFKKLCLDDLTKEVSSKFKMCEEDSSNVCNRLKSV
jgi:hypothetical protein